MEGVKFLGHFAVRVHTLYIVIIIIMRWQRIPYYWTSGCNRVFHKICIKASKYNLPEFRPIIFGNICRERTPGPCYEKFYCSSDCRDWSTSLEQWIDRQRHRKQREQLHNSLPVSVLTRVVGSTNCKSANMNRNIFAHGGRHFSCYHCSFTRDSFLCWATVCLRVSYNRHLCGVPFL